MVTTTPYHEGELAVQHRAGVAHAAERNAAVLRDTIPPGALSFIRQQPMVVLGTHDAGGRVWASMLLGEAGFLEPGGDARSLRVRLGTSASDQPDPFLRNIAATRRFGMLVIELGSRRRLRINGGASAVNGTELYLEVEEAYPNCPKYIQRRNIRRLSGDVHSPGYNSREGSALDSEATALIRKSDTFFVSTAHPSRGVDVSHRGGHPGFVKVLDDATLRIPDYRGNAMFNTLGNLAVNPKAGLVFPDFDGRRILQLTGSARILWDQPDPANETGGTGRYWQFQIDAWIETAMPGSLMFEFLDYSPFNPPPAGE